MFKFNNGRGAVVCDSCRTIIKDNVSPTDYKSISKGIDFCDQCSIDLKEVDNFDLITDNLEFNDLDEFYFIQVIQRKKDGNNTDVGNNGYRTIKTFYIYSHEQFIAKKNKIKELCVKNNARAYIHLNKRNAKEIALRAIQEYAKLVSEGNAFQGYRVYDSMCGQFKARGYKPFWIIDLDFKDPELISKYKEIINTCRGNEEEKIHLIIPTLHGVHLITTGFDINQFKQKLALMQLDNVDIQKDNPTLLYYKVPTLEQ